VQYSSEHHFLGKVAGLLLLFSGKQYSDSCNYLDKAAGLQASITTIFMAVGGSYWLQLFAALAIFKRLLGSDGWRRQGHAELQV